MKITIAVKVACLAVVVLPFIPLNVYAESNSVLIKQTELKLQVGKSSSEFQKAEASVKENIEQRNTNMEICVGYPKDKPIVRSGSGVGGGNNGGISTGGIIDIGGGPANNVLPIWLKGLPKIDYSFMDGKSKISIQSGDHKVSVDLGSMTYALDLKAETITVTQKGGVVFENGRGFVGDGFSFILTRKDNKEAYISALKVMTAKISEPLIVRLGQVSDGKTDGLYRKLAKLVNQMNAYIRWVSRQHVKTGIRGSVGVVVPGGKV